MEIPARITITNALFAMDGGSTCLMGFDSLGEEVSISLTWSIESQRENRTALSINGCVVVKRSPEELRLLEVLEAADYAADREDDNDAEHDHQPPSKRLILGEDIKRVFQGIDEGPSAGCRAMVAELIAKVRSDVHISGAVFRSLTDAVAEKSMAGIAACRRGEFVSAVELLASVEQFLGPAAQGYLERARRKLSQSNHHNI